MVETRPVKHRGVLSTCSELQLPQNNSLARLESLLPGGELVPVGAVAVWPVLGELFLDHLDEGSF